MIKQCCLLLLIVFIACGNPSEPEVDGISRGFFAGEVGTLNAGGLYEKLGGPATFTYSPDDSVITISLISTLLSDSTMTEVTFFIRSEGRISAGTYPFMETTTMGAQLANGFTGVYVSPEISDGIYYSESGTMEITHSAVDTIEGIFDLKIFTEVSTGPDTNSKSYTTLTGVFNAIEQ